MQRYAITDRTLLPAHPDGLFTALANQAAQWSAAGIDYIQLREKDLTPPALETLTCQLALSIRQHTRLLISGLSPAQALQCGASGVHLPGPINEPDIQQARTQGALISVSCHTLDDVTAAVAAQADLILWAPVFHKPIPGQPPLPGTGLAALTQACHTAAPTPVFALGGITPANASSCMQAGAIGIAAIRLFHGPPADWQL
jgi:thiamine-phosphate pyrophosphorylase